MSVSIQDVVRLDATDPVGLVDLPLEEFGFGDEAWQLEAGL